MPAKIIAKPIKFNQKRIRLQPFKPWTSSGQTLIRSYYSSGHNFSGKTPNTKRIKIPNKLKVKEPSVVSNCVILWFRFHSGKALKSEKKSQTFAKVDCSFIQPAKQFCSTQ
eukprot:Gb_09330 [translate_table: standard]